MAKKKVIFNIDENLNKEFAKICIDYSKSKSYAVERLIRQYVDWVNRKRQEKKEFGGH